jgi:hypothetical protein
MFIFPIEHFIIKKKYLHYGTKKHFQYTFARERERQRQSFTYENNTFIVSFASLLFAHLMFFSFLYTLSENQTLHH